MNYCFDKGYCLEEHRICKIRLCFAGFVWSDSVFYAVLHTTQRIIQDSFKELPFYEFERNYKLTLKYKLALKCVLNWYVQ